MLKDMDFKCKKFALNHDKSTMKVGTDAILLASCVNRYLGNEEIKNVLDVGTGCGIIALCMAQIFEASNVFAIDIDRDSALQTKENFEMSPFANRMYAKWDSYQKYASSAVKKYDLIVSNMPFFTDSLISPNKKRTLARHNVSLPVKDFIAATCLTAAANAFVALILPTKPADDVTVQFGFMGFIPLHTIDIYSKPDSLPCRRVVIFMSTDKADKLPKEKRHSFCIRDERNNYSDSYKQLTEPFLL